MCLFVLLGFQFSAATEMSHFMFVSNSYIIKCLFTEAAIVNPFSMDSRIKLKGLALGIFLMTPLTLESLLSRENFELFTGFFGG